MLRNVPQDSNFKHLLYLLYVNDINKSYESKFVLIPPYVDTNIEINNLLN